MRRTCVEPMYLCKHCGHISDDVKTIHGLYEDISDNVCPICGEDMELTDNQCAVCHKYITDETRLDNSGLCKECACKLTGSFEEIIENLLPEQKECLLDFIEMRYWQ